MHKTIMYISYHKAHKYSSFYAYFIQLHTYENTCEEGGILLRLRIFDMRLKKYTPFPYICSLDSSTVDIKRSRWERACISQRLLLYVKEMKLHIADNDFFGSVRIFFRNIFFNKEGTNSVEDSEDHDTNVGENSEPHVSNPNGT